MRSEGTGWRRAASILLSLVLIVGFTGCIGGEGEIPPDGEEDGPTTLDEDDNEDTGEDDDASPEDEEASEDEGSSQEEDQEPETVEASFEATGSTPISAFASVDGTGYGVAVIPPFAEGNETFHDETLQGVTELEFQVDWDEPVDMLVNITLLSPDGDEETQHVGGMAPIEHALDVPEPYGMFEITVSAATAAGDASLAYAAVEPSVDYQLHGNVTMVHP